MKNLKHQTAILRSLNEVQHLISDNIDEINDHIDAIASCIANSISEEHTTESKEETACAEDRILEEEQKRFQQNYNHEKLHHMTKYHLENVQASTGEITVADYKYCMNLTQRILAYQSSQNPG